MMTKTRNVAILIFDDVELLDFCGPYEVFSVTGRKMTPPPFHVYTVAERLDPVLVRNGLSVNPHYILAAFPSPDVLVVPGGYGVRREMLNESLLDWIQKQAHSAELVLSVCTGSLLLARSGLLKDRAATTHHSALAELRAAAPEVVIRDTERFVDTGQIITSAGISAGIDASLYTVARLLGKHEAEETARHMEYDWKPEHQARQSASNS